MFQSAPQHFGQADLLLGGDALGFAVELVGLVGFGFGSWLEIYIGVGIVSNGGMDQDQGARFKASRCKV